MTTQRQETQLGDYLLEEEIGRGGMARVFRARYLPLDRICALKLLHPTLTDEAIVARFLREARQAGALEHPNIVTIYDTGQIDNSYFIAMRYLEGRTLREVGEHDPLPFDLAVDYLRQLASALDYAHSRGVIHRDVKPDNIIIDNEDRITLTDFGIAQAAEASRLTTRNIIGTPVYMAPEQIQGLPATPQTDIYQLGVVVYELLTGVPPFLERSPQAILYAHVQVTPQPAHERATDLPPEISDVLDRALRKQPDMRYLTAESFVEELAGAGSQSERAPLLVGRASRQEIMPEQSTSSDQIDAISFQRHGDVPIPLTTFIGRQHEQTTLRNLLTETDSSHRLITVSGPGGSGKTRLAIEVARNLTDAFPGGVYFVPLATIRDPSFVLPTLLRALDVHEVISQAPLQRLINALHEKRVLLILDNIEQVIDVAPELLEVVSALPELTLLVTSRIRLNIRGEYEFSVMPLASPDPMAQPSASDLMQYPAIQLFVERAQDILANFRLTEENVAAVAGICNRLEGLPLAIELAAVRLKILTLDQLYERLDRSLELLTGGLRDLPARQRTLRDTIAWSYQLLTAAEQEMFRQLSVFVGGWTLEAAEEVVTLSNLDNATVLDCLTAAVDSHLVRRTVHEDGSLRFDMLQILVDYASEQLSFQTKEKETATDRHTNYFLHVAQLAQSNLTGSSQLEWLARLDTEHDNMRSVIARTIEQHDYENAARMVAALVRYWELRGYLSEGTKWITAIPEEQVSDPETKIQLLNSTGVLLFHQGEYERANDYFRMSLDEATCQDHVDAVVAEVLLYQGSVALCTDMLQEANELHHRSLAIFRTLDDTYWSGISLLGLGVIDSIQGDPDGALQRFQESLQLLRTSGDRVGVAMALANLGELAFRNRDMHDAKKHFQQCLHIVQELGNLPGLADTLESLACISAEEEDLTTAAKLFGGAAKIRETIMVSELAINAEENETYRNRLQDSLGTERFMAHFNAGYDIETDEIVGEALESRPASL